MELARLLSASASPPQVHSVPKFPAVFGSAYSYPVKQSEYGQSFLCMSLSAAGIESAAKTLLTSRSVPG